MSMFEICKWSALGGVLLSCSACARSIPAICPEGPSEREIAYPDPLTALAVDPSTTHLGVGSEGNVALIELASGAPQVLGNLGYIRAVEFSPDGKVLAASGDDVRLWDVATGEMIFDLDHGYNHAQMLVFSPTEPVLATCAGDEAYTWSMETGEQLMGVEAACPVGFTPDGRMLVTSDEQHLDVWRPDVTRYTHMLLEDSYMRSFAFSPDGTRMAIATQPLETGEESGTVAVLDLWYRMRKIHVKVLEVAFSDDGDRLIMAGPGHLATIWSATRRVRLAAFEHQATVVLAELSFSGARLATLDVAGTITLWDVDTREPLLRREQELQYASFSWATTDDRLFSGDPDGGIRVDCR